MYEPSQGLGAKRIAAIAILVMLAAGLGAGASYYLVGAAHGRRGDQHRDFHVGLDHHGHRAAAPVFGRRVIVAASINAVQIYKNSNESVVTVDGFITTTVSTVSSERKPERARRRSSALASS